MVPLPWLSPLLPYGFISCLHMHFNFQIPQPLASRLNITAHSTVRIKPVKSNIKVASSIRLQPLKSLVSSEVAMRCIFFRLQNCQLSKESIYFFPYVHQIFEILSAA